MLVTVAPTQPMSKSQKRSMNPDQVKTKELVDHCMDVMDTDMQAVCFQYSSLVSMFLINEMTANKLTFEEAAVLLARNFMLCDNVKNMSAMGERLKNKDAEEKITGEL